MASTFEYIGGDPALDFVNTVDWTEEGPADERLNDYEDLLHWAQGSGRIPVGVAQRLRRLAAARPRQAAAALAAALRVRQVLREVFAGMVAEEPTEAPLREFNAVLARTMNRLELVEGTPARWAWRGMDQELDSVLWPVIRAAADLLTSADAARLRMCSGPACGWLFVDRSRNGFRRWCQMRTCGTREKTRRRRTTPAA